MTCPSKAYSFLYGSRGNLHNLILSLFHLGSSEATPSLALQPFFVLLHTPNKGTFHPDLMSVFVKDYGDRYNGHLYDTQQSPGPMGIELRVH